MYATTTRTENGQASLPDKMPAKGVQSSYDPVKKMERPSI